MNNENVRARSVSERCKEIRAYITRTKIDKSASRFSLGSNEVYELHDLMSINPFDAIVIAFEYGKAKGYRAAKAKARKNRLRKRNPILSSSTEVCT